MGVENRSNNEWIPETESAPISVVVDGDVFWDRLVLISEYNEAHVSGVQSAILWFGHQLVTLGDEEKFVLRDSMGFKKPIDLMDDMFSYNRGLSEIKPEHPLPIHYPAESRELYMNYANTLRIDLEELAARMQMAGLYVLEQLMDGQKSLEKSVQGASDAWNLRVPGQRKYVRKKLRRYYRSEEYKARESSGFEVYSDW